MGRRWSLPPSVSLKGKQENMTIRRLLEFISAVEKQEKKCHQGIAILKNSTTANTCKRYKSSACGTQIGTETGHEIGETMVSMLLSTVSSINFKQSPIFSLLIFLPTYHWKHKFL